MEFLFFFKQEKYFFLFCKTWCLMGTAACLLLLKPSQLSTLRATSVYLQPDFISYTSFSTAFSLCSSKGYLLTSINTFRRNVCFSKEKQVLILKKVFNSCSVSKIRRNPISWRKTEKYSATCLFHAIGTFHFNLKFLTSNTEYLLSPIKREVPQQYNQIAPFTTVSLPRDQ